VLRAERHQLTDALLSRLTMLHRCAATLDELDQRSQRAGVIEDLVVRAADATAYPAVENELATEALDDLDADLQAIADSYRRLEGPQI
jgi:hypothetical protein